MLVIIISVYVVIMLILAFIPWYHEYLLEQTALLPAMLKFTILFFFDPLEYLWKWIAGLLAALLCFLLSNSKWELLLLFSWTFLNGIGHQFAKLPLTPVVYSPNARIRVSKLLYARIYENEKMLPDSSIINSEISE